MRRLTAASAVLLIALSACKGSEEAPGPDETPQERLVEAKAQFDDSEFIDFTLETDSLPEGIEGLLRAEGTGSHAPAFTGVVDVETGVTPLEDTSLIAVGGAVYVDLPFIGWTDLDPADYGAPDPADLMKTDGGISSLFTATTGVSEGESERDGEVVLTTLKGTLAGEAVQQVFRPPAATRSTSPTP